MKKKLIKYTTKKANIKKDLIGKIKEVLISYFKGQLIVMLLTASIFYLIFSYLEVKNASILSIISGALSIIPIFGMLTAAVITLISMIFDGQKILELPLFLEAVFILVIYLLINQLIDWIISPLVIGKSLKIHPLILFFAVIIAVSLFGIIGAIIAVPAFAVMRVVWDSFNDQKMD